MFSQKVIVDNKTGLHARPASIFIQYASEFKSDITIQKGQRTISAKSIIELISLGVAKGTEIVITANGSDEKQAVTTLVNLIKAKFEEE